MYEALRWGGLNFQLNMGVLLCLLFFPLEKFALGVVYKLRWQVFWPFQPNPSLKIGSELFCFDIGNVLKNIFFRVKTCLFFKIESWNFHHLFEKKNHETSQNFNSIRQPIEKIKSTIVWMSWMSWNFVRFQEIKFQTDAESFSFLSWKTNKFYSWKKKFFQP